jgi:integrase/recombinase XerD
MTTNIKDRKKSQKKSITWPEALDIYDTHLRAKNASPRTIGDYLRELRHLAARLGRRRRPPAPTGVTTEDLRAYQADLFVGTASPSGRPLSAGSVARVTAAIRDFFGFLADEGIVSASPAARLSPPKVPPRLPGSVLTPKEVRSLLTAPDRMSPLGLRDRAMLEILFATGVRRDELCKLDLADLDHHERELVVQHGKGDKPRRIPLVRSAYHEVVVYLERARPALAAKGKAATSALLLSSKGSRLSHAGVMRALHEIEAKSGLKTNLTPHVFRRTFATTLLESGASLRHIQLLLGHADLTTTAVYLNISTKTLRRELLLKHPRERLDV